MTRSESDANRALAESSVTGSLRRLAQLQALHGALRNVTPIRPGRALGAYDARQRLMRLEGYNPYDTAGAL